jgi:selenocysteine-specific elongation factor
LTVIIGTAGHIDHGKTALVRALTGVDTDRLPEEKKRGISIDLGFAYMPAPNGAVIGFVDVPGHYRFIHNMLAGAAGIDFVLLVVALDDGVMPQTREHLAIIDLLGVRRGLVVLSKRDLVPPERVDQVHAEVDALLAETALAGADSVVVSSTTGEGAEVVRARLLAEATAFESRGHRGAFRLAVDRSFSLPGAGTIVTGTVMSGGVAVGDLVQLSPSGLMARVRGIHAQNQPAKVGRAGERCALNLVGSGVSRDAVRRGEVALDPTLHAPCSRIDTRLRLLDAKPAGQGIPVRLHHAAAEVGARVVFLSEDQWAQLVLDRPIAAAVGDRFVIRDVSGYGTLGGGEFVDVRAPARKRRSPERLRELAARAETDPAAALARLTAGPPYHVDLGGFGRDRALTQAEVGSIVAPLGLIVLSREGRQFAIGASCWVQLRQQIAERLRTFHATNPDLQGMPREPLRLSLSAVLPDQPFAVVLQHLAGRREVVVEGAWVRLPDHEARFTPAQGRIWQKVEPLLRGEARYRPPRVRDLACLLREREPEIRKLLKMAARMGRVDEIAPDHFFLRSVISEIVAVVAELSRSVPEHGFAAADLRDRLQNGRKVAIQILEFLDRHGVTLRRGDYRRLNPRRLDIFGPREAPEGVSAAKRIEDSAKRTPPRIHGEVARPSALPGRKSSVRTAATRET